MWEMNKRLDDFKIVSDNMRYDGQGSRADIIDYLIKRVQKREEQLKEIKNRCEDELNSVFGDDFIIHKIIEECE